MLHAKDKLALHSDSAEDMYPIHDPFLRAYIVWQLSSPSSKSFTITVWNLQLQQQSMDQAAQFGFTMFIRQFLIHWIGCQEGKQNDTFIHMIMNFYWL